MCGSEQTELSTPLNLGSRLATAWRALIFEPWQARLVSATTAEAVLLAVREYLDALPGEFLASLPALCQPPPMLCAQDVSSFAFTLMHRCVATDDGPALVGMNHFFAHASHRLAAILIPDGFTLRPAIPFR